jgi:putative flippase GtrA
METIRRINLIKILDYQLFRFGVVGALAASVHFLSVYAIVSIIDLIPIIANIFAFLIAFIVSYFGHSLWTFGHKKHNHSSAATKFFSVAVFSFIVNEGGYFLLLEYTSMHYLLSLFIVLITVPVMTFILSKYWAFN